MGIEVDTMPGPLSSTVTRYSLWSTLSILTAISGSIWASSQASRALSTASFTPMMRLFTGESKPRICRFFSKNSETEISFWPLASF